MATANVRIEIQGVRELREHLMVMTAEERRANLVALEAAVREVQYRSDLAQWVYEGAGWACPVPDRCMECGNARTAPPARVQ